MTPLWLTKTLCNLEFTRLWLGGPTYRDLPYARIDGDNLSLDLYLPFFKQNAPLVISLHGGGWEQGSYKDAGTNWLVGHGFAVANVQYRLTPKAQFPAQIHDLKAAIRWLRDHAIELGYNATRIGVVGISSGGHLAMLAGTTNHNKPLEGTLGNHLNKDSSVQAIVSYSGASDLLLRAKTQPTHTDPPHSVVHKLLGTTPKADPEKALLASPAHHLENSPTTEPAPLYILHGELDEQVKIDQAHRIINAYQKTNAPLKQTILPEGGHGGSAFYTATLRQSVADFLTKYLV